MTPETVRKLLGGYAAGTLTEDERKALYTAALQDPALFEAIAEEDVLRETLEDPECRADLLHALDGAAAKPKRSIWSRLWSPIPLAIAASLAITALTIPFLRTVNEQPHQVAVAPLAKEVRTELPAVYAPLPEEKRRPEPPARQPAAKPASNRQPASVAPEPQKAVEEKREVAADFAAPRQEMYAAGSPAVPARAAPPQLAEPELARAASADVRPPIQYTLLRRNAEGTWQPVQLAALQKGDAIRVRLEASRPLFVVLAVRGETQPLFTGSATPERPVEIAKEITIDGPKYLLLDFRPAAPMRVRSALMPQASRAKAVRSAESDTQITPESGTIEIPLRPR